MSATAPGGAQMMRVCSADRTHDLSEADPWVTVCPICGHNIIEVAAPVEPEPEPEPVAVKPAEPPEGRFPPPYKDEKEQQPPETPSEIDPPQLPPPALICAKVAAHDIAARADDATTCPQPGCGGALIQLECPTDLTHDVSLRAPGSFACPVCASALVEPICTFDAQHSMVGRKAGQKTCPVPLCGREVKRRVYVPPAAPSDPISPPPLLPWWQRHRRAVTLAGAVLAILLLSVGLARWLEPAPVPSSSSDPNRPSTCAALPPDPAAALKAVSDKIKAGIAPAEAASLGRQHLACGLVEPALLLLRIAAENHDAASARALGQLFDPSAGPNVPSHQPPNLTRAATWYVSAAKDHGAGADQDLERLYAWIKAQPVQGDDETKALNLLTDALHAQKSP